MQALEPAITAVIVVIRLWQKRQRMLAFIGAIFGIMCLSWSLASATGFALSFREHTAAMHARALALRQELAAQSSLALEARIDEARQQLATHPAVGLTAVLGTEEATLRRGLALLLAVLVEVGSAFGFALAHAATANPQPPRSHAPHRTDSPPRIGNAPKAGARNPAPSAVVSFAEQAARLKRRRRRTVPPRPVTGSLADECVQRDNDGCVGARNGYAAYCQWADHVGVEAVAIPTGRHQPHACRKIAQALHRSGVEFVGHAKPSVRLLRTTILSCGRLRARGRVVG